MAKSPVSVGKPSVGRDVAKYMQQQKPQQSVNTGMADAAARWPENQKK